MTFKFGTKAETLENLARESTHFSIAPLLYFEAHRWRDESVAITATIRERFESQLIVRSSMAIEDGGDSSQAGVFESLLSVDPQRPVELEAAISRVVESSTGNPRDQVLIQPMVTDIAVSGVIMTHDLADGSPYYVLNYDDFSGKSDSITSGTHTCKTVRILRGCDSSHVDSPRVQEDARPRRGARGSLRAHPSGYRICHRPGWHDPSLSGATHLQHLALAP